MKLVANLKCNILETILFQEKFTEIILKTSDVSLNMYFFDLVTLGSEIFYKSKILTAADVYSLDSTLKIYTFFKDPYFILGYDIAS